MYLAKTFIDNRILFPTVLVVRTHLNFTDGTLFQYGRYDHIATVKEIAECQSLLRS